jgi:hypothetical protein
VTALVASGCGAAVSVRVDVERSGSGSVNVTITLPAATATQLEDLTAGLPLADLHRAGWVVDGPRGGPDGSTVVSADHTFSNLAQVPVLMADIAGSGPTGSRPFRLAVTEAKGTLEDRFQASGTVNLDCAVACFDDLHLAQEVGYPLGLRPAQVARLLGAHPDRDLSFRIVLSLPGKASATNASFRTKQALVWSPALGHSTSISATTESVNVVFVRYLLIAVGVGAVVVLVTAGSLMVRRRRRLRVTVTGPS